MSSLSNPSYESHEPSDGVGAGQQLPVYSTSGLWELRDVPGHYSSSFASSASIRSSHQMDPDSDRYADRPKRERLDRLPSLEEFNLGDFEHFDIDCALSPYHLDDFTVGSAYEGDLSFGSDVNPQGRGNPGDLNLDAGELPNTDGPPFGHVDDKSFPGPLSVTEPFHEPARESLLEAEVQQGLVDQTKQLELRRGHMDPPIEASGSSSHRIDSGVSVQFTPSSKRALSIQDCREEQDLCADGEDLRSKVDTMWEAEILESCGISPELVQYRGPYLPVQGVLGGTSYKVLSWLAAQQDHGKFDSPPELLERRDPSLSGEGLFSSNHVEATKTSRIQAELDKTRRENERLKLKIKSLEDCADKASQRRSSNLDATLHGEAVDFQAFLHFDVAVPEQGSQSRSPSAAGRSLSLQHSGNLTVRSFSVSRNRRSRSPSPGASIRSRRPSISSINSHDYRIDLPDPSRLYATQNQQSPRMQKHPARFLCHLCPKKFTRPYNLRSHLRSHINERPFVCSVCSKAFARAQDCRRHEGLHSRENAEKGKAEAPQEVPHQSHDRSTQLPSPDQASHHSSPH